jgi:nicotinate-nucleotide pyrophosphorylase (carboxylating)
MAKEFHQSEWDTELEEDLCRLLRMAVLEDLDRECDWTTVTLVPEDARAKAQIVSRVDGCFCGARIGPIVFHTMNCQLEWRPLVEDGGRVARGDAVAQISGSARDLLTSERILLNILGHLSGIATATNQFAERIRGYSCRIYDTRKTLPGWRRLEKYAVRCGGGMNHRHGLSEAILIKDNHLAFWHEQRREPYDAVISARELWKSLGVNFEDRIIEIEVDTLEQLRNVLPARPDIVLLDNFVSEDLKTAVKLRDQMAPGVELEASGGVDLASVSEIAATGVDRISVGKTTHSAVCLDLGLDWSDFSG